MRFFKVNECVWNLKELQKIVFGECIRFYFYDGGIAAIDDSNGVAEFEITDFLGSEKMFLDLDLFVKTDHLFLKEKRKLEEDSE